MTTLSRKTPLTISSVATVCGSSAGLRYDYTVFQGTVPLIFDTPTVLNGATYKLQSLDGSANTVAQLTVTVSDSVRSRSSQATMTMSVLPELSPLVSVVSSLGAASIMNAGDILKLTASVGMPANLNGAAVWSVDSNDVDLSKAALSSLTASFSASVAPTNTQVFMFIGANSLPVGVTLTFSLTASIPSESTVTVATVQVIVNAPPKLGAFSVDPPTGTELTTPFTFSASQWQDPQLPLKYQFGIISLSGAFTVMNSLSALTYGTSYLTAGSDTDGNKVTCVAMIFDAMAANTSVTTQVVVKKGAVMSAAEQQAYVTFSTAQYQAKLDARTQVLSSISTLVALEDPDAQTVSAWVSSMSEATQASDELTVDTASSVLSTANNILTSAVA
eukprot:gene38536-47586_t